MSDSPLGSFLLPPPFKRPRLSAVLHERSVGVEAARYAVRAVEEAGRLRPRPRLTGDQEPVLLVPGFMAGDGTLTAMAASLRHRGFRTYRADIRANIGCTQDAAEHLERRLETIVERRGQRAQIVGHSLGGMLARGVAVRRPDLVSGIVTMGSPMLAPGAHHLSLTWSIGTLVALSAVGVPGLMSSVCVGGRCAWESFEESRAPLAPGVGFTALYSRRDGIVDWRACVDPIAEPVEVTTSHCGMAVDPHVIDVVAAALTRHAAQRETVVPQIA